MTDRDLLELIAEKIVKMDERMDRMDGRIDRMDGRMDRMEKDIAETKLSLVRLENKFDEKIKVLFDGQKQHTEQLQRIEEKVSSHEEFILKRIK